MDALAGYGSSGSDGEEEKEEEEEAPQQRHAPPRGGLFASLPPPSHGLLASLPPPKAAAGPPGKRVVQLRLPVNAAALAADDEEDARAPKRPRPVAAAAPAAGGLAALLPKPVNDQLGGGASGSKLDLSDERAPAPGAARAPHPSDAYRVGAEPPPAPAPALHPSMMFMMQPGSSVTPAEAAGWSVGEVDAGGAGYADEGPDAMLERALEAERAAAARHGRPSFAPPAVIELSAAQLTAGREKLVATKSLTGLAFGPEYEARLRAEAGPKPAEMQRRKHQIGSLLYDAKQRELQMMEGRLQGMKSKRETQAKYGW